MTSTDTSKAMTLRLVAPAATLLGRELRLQDGDILLAINGVAFHGDEFALRSRITASKNPVALSFLRGKQTLVVLSSTARLGAWEATPAIEMTPMARINPDMLVNWEVMRSTDGAYDLHPMTGTLLALIAAPVWLLQMRLWIPAAAFMAGPMVAVAVSPLMAAAVYVAAGLHIWNGGHKYIRKDRQSRGLTPHVVIAAPSERAAHSAYKKLFPEARFLFGTTSAETEAAPEVTEI